MSGWRYQFWRATSLIFLAVVAANALADNPVTEAAGGAPSREAPVGEINAANNCFAPNQLSSTSVGTKPSSLARSSKGLSIGLIGSISSGLFSVGTSIGAESRGTTVSRNPFSDKPFAVFQFPDNVELDLQLTTSIAPTTDSSDPFASVDKLSTPVKDAPGVTIGVRINEPPVKERSFSFANLYLVDPDCNQRKPDSRFVFKVYRDSRSSFTVEFWRWRNGALAKHWTSLGSGAWTDKLGSGAAPLWVGARFDDLTPDRLGQGGWSLVTSWTYMSGDEVILQPRVFDILSQTQLQARFPGQAAGHETRIPVSREMPGVGQLFRREAELNKEPLQVFVTPRVFASAE